MARRRYIFKDGKCIEVTQEISESKSAFVHDDTMDAIKSPIDGKMYDSLSKYKHHVEQEHGCDIVGNERVNRKRQTGLSDEKILDGIYRAEAILDDPTKKRAEQNRNLELMERRMKALGLKDINDLH